MLLFLSRTNTSKNDQKNFRDPLNTIMADNWSQIGVMKNITISLSLEIDIDHDN